jgi:ribosomal protein S27E
MKHLGYFPQAEKHHYMCHSEAGVLRHMTDDEYIPTGTVVDLPYYQWNENSGWLHWQCDKCKAIFWTLGSPGSPVECLCCGAVDTVPLDAVVQEYEGAE